MEKHPSKGFIVEEKLVGTTRVRLLSSSDPIYENTIFSIEIIGIHPRMARTLIHFDSQSEARIVYSAMAPRKVSSIETFTGLNGVYHKGRPWFDRQERARPVQMAA